MAINHLQTRAQKRKLRVRGKLHGTAERPRLNVYRSNEHTYLQAIDDNAGKTLAAANDLKLDKGTKKERAQKVAENIAAQLKKQKVTKLAFDRGSYTYHGRLQVVADTLREAGIEV